jgi:hypothetical protein
MSNVTVSGPLFDGRAVRATKDYCDDLERTYAEKTEDAVRSAGTGAFKNPTGNWSRHINVSAAGDGQQVTDSGIVYGPWLEGTGSRNATTRFKGYSTFRKTTQKMNAQAGSYANQFLRKYLGRMQ